MANIARPCKILSLLALLLVALVSAYLLTRTKPPQPAVGSELDVSSWEPETGGANGFLDRHVGVPCSPDLG